ncbi:MULTISPECIES: ribosome-inactivating family protein [unclassified Streptomyces]|uniref:ribosome-inactivating family protein n=1 Tax=unclassified Streptomyces TaxID=2593676 RepID=UPI0036A5E359
MKINPSARPVLARIVLLVLALLASVGLTQAPAPTATAVTPRWVRVDWDITHLQPNTSSSYAANSYWSMLASVRQYASTGIPPHHGATYSITDPNSNRYIEVALVDWSNEAVPHRLSLILDARNLYAVGFFTPQSRYLFRDMDVNRIVASYNAVHGGLRPEHFTYLPYGENYNDFSRDEWRANTSFLGLRNDINTLVALSGNIGQNTPPAIAAGRSLTQVVAAVSEAARFGWIQNRILNTIRSGSDIDGHSRYSHLGPFGAEMETSWAALTRLLAANAAGRQGVPVTINNRVYANRTEVEQGDPSRNMPAIDVFVALGSQW